MGHPAPGSIVFLKDFPRYWNGKLCIPVWLSTSMDSRTTSWPCVCILWRGGVSCHVSAACHSSVAAHWSKYHYYKQAPSQFDLRCLKAILKSNKQTDKSTAFETTNHSVGVLHADGALQIVVPADQESARCEATRLDAFLNLWQRQVQCVHIPSRAKLLKVYIIH